MNLYQIFKTTAGVTTDSRAIKGGELFFALKGENFDGNAYALKALEAGAAYAVVDQDSEVADALKNAQLSKEQGDRIIAVPDTLRALQELARTHRENVRVHGKPLTVIGLTGTNGKTTTKELIRTVLSVKYNVTATEGNLNNHIGVPLTLLKIKGDDQSQQPTELAVIEMGASHPGDIKELVDIALPDFGLITNVGKAHLLGFGSFEGVKATKGELYDHLMAKGACAFVNVDNPHLVQMAQERTSKDDLLQADADVMHILPYGLSRMCAKVLPSSAEHPFLRIALPADSGYQQDAETSDFAVRCGIASDDGESAKIIETNLVGAYNADNVMAAMAVGAHFGVSTSEAMAAISAYVPQNNRSQLTRTASNVLIIDAYNANPTSMAAALDNFANVEAERKVALLGDMLELGDESLAEHKRIAQKAMELGLDMVCFVGAEFTRALEGVEGRFKVMPTSAALAEEIKKEPLKGCNILIKGSRGIRMEVVLPVLD